MESLIFPVVLLVLVGLWGAFESGRKFRREFRKRGRDWASVSAAMENGEGTLAVDTIWGPQRGLGHPTIWWIDRPLPPGEDLTPFIETGGAARLVNCPKSLRGLVPLQDRFGVDRVAVHSWAVTVPAEIPK